MKITTIKFHKFTVARLQLHLFVANDSELKKMAIDLVSQKDYPAVAAATVPLPQASEISTRVYPRPKILH